MFGKVLITGAGGSIGSALAKAIRCDDLILYDACEYGLYAINEELSGRCTAVLGNCTDIGRVSRFAAGCDVIFHCAAYKHVPLAEGINATEVMWNNVEGTRAVLDAGNTARRIVLLSTDKAINPVGVMGRSKADCERLALSRGRTVARLGNILETSGSVIPKFRRQIEAGGPVTVTHPEVTRYFISMEKCVGFLQSCARKAPGEYQVDMGEPVKILDIARSMIGDRDIAIEFTGLRPGEKLHEEIEREAA